MSKISNSFKQGYVINKLKYTSSGNKDNQAPEFDKLHYPSGIIPFVILLILYCVGITTVLIVAHYKDPRFNQWWHNYVVAVSGASLCLNLLWLIARSGIFNSFGYSGLKMSRITKFNLLKEKIHITPVNTALKDINTYQDYNQYVTFRQKNTKKWMFISLGTHGAIFAISLIIFLVVEYTH